MKPHSNLIEDKQESPHLQELRQLCQQRQWSLREVQRRSYRYEISVVHPLRTLKACYDVRGTTENSMSYRTQKALLERLKMLDGPTAFFWALTEPNVFEIDGFKQFSSR